MAPRSKHGQQPSSQSPPAPSTSIPEDPTAVKLDGRTLEGGGQILRLSLCLSSLTGRPVHIHDIRGNRPRGGGLGRQHLTGVEWLAGVSGARLEDVEVGTRELLFKPGGQQPTWYPPAGTSVKQSTPGSVGLVLQAVLPCILFSNDSTEPVVLSITGGTHVSFSPSYEYIKHVFLPTLHEKLGLPHITIDLVKDGWTHGPLVVGEVVLAIPPMTGKLSGFTMRDRGTVERIEIFPRIPGAGHRALDFGVQKHVQPAFPAMYASGNITTHPLVDSKDDKRYYILMVAYTSQGFRIGYDLLYQRKVKDVTKVIEYVVQDCTRGLVRELERGGCVDEYLQDQLVVFQTLAEGESVVNGGGWEGSLHTRTARWVAKEMFGTKWDGRGGCEGGIGYIPGSTALSQVNKAESATKEAADGIESISDGVEKLEV